MNCRKFGVNYYCCISEVQSMCIENYFQEVEVHTYIFWCKEKIIVNKQNQAECENNTAFLLHLWGNSFLDFTKSAIHIYFVAATTKYSL